MKLCQNVLQTHKLRKSFLLTVFSSFVRSVSRSGRGKMWNLELVLLWYLTHSSKLTMDESTLINSFSSVLILGRCERDALRRKKSRWPTRVTNFKIIKCTKIQESRNYCSEINRSLTLTLRTFSYIIDWNLPTNSKRSSFLLFIRSWFRIYFKTDGSEDVA